MIGNYFLCHGLATFKAWMREEIFSMCFYFEIFVNMKHQNEILSIQGPILSATNRVNPSDGNRRIII